jgi:hypothetical protein
MAVGQESLSWWMYAVPYRRFAIVSTLSPAAAVTRLADFVQPRRRSWWKPVGDRPFEGEITGTSFVLRRVITRRNSFLPRIRGELAPAGAGTVILGTMSLHPATAVFTIVWFSGVTTIAILSGRAAVLHGPAIFGVFPLGMIAAAALLVAGGFWFEARRAARRLAEIYSSPLLWLRGP